MLIATLNPGKVLEFRQMLGNDNFTWQSLADFPKVQEIEETGETFRANAILKAAGYARQTGQWALADDSGLEVDALGNKPGVYSARWAEKHKSGSGDAANNALLLQQLLSVPNEKRTARFVCVLALADPRGRIVLTTRDCVSGRILSAPVGAGGFGYDPLFYIERLGRTTAQLPPEEKNQLSHRGKSLRRLKVLLEKIGPLAQSF